MVARQQSLLYLEKLRLFHAVVTAILSAGPARLGAVALVAGPRDFRATSCSSARSASRSCTARAIWRWRSST